MSIIKFRQAAAGWMIPVVGLILLALLVSIFVGFGSARFARDDEREDGEGAQVVFTVNGEEVTDTGYNQQMAMMQQQMSESGQRPGPSQLAQYKSALISSYINQHMIASAARKAGIKVSRRDIKQEMNNRYKALVDQYKMQVFGQDYQKKSDRELAAKLSEVSGASLADIRKQVETTSAPELIRTDLLAKKFEEKVRSQVQMNDDDLRDAYREITVSHILVKTDTRPEASAKKRADEVYAKASQGGDFAALAKQFSEDPGSGAQGGQLPPITASAPYVPEFKKAAFQLKKPGDISKPVKSQFGFHIIKLDKTALQLPKDFDKKKDDYRKEKQTEKSQEIWTETAQKIRNEAKLTFKDPEFKAYWLLSQAQADPAKATALEDQAAKAFEEHIKKNRNLPEADTSYVQLAMIKQRQGKPDEAQKWLTEGLEGFEDPQARMMLGQMLLDKGKTAEAAEHYEMASYAVDPYIHAQLMQIFQTRVPNKQLADKSKEIWDRYLEQQEAQRRAQEQAAKKAEEEAKKAQDKTAKKGQPKDSKNAPRGPAQGDNPQAGKNEKAPE